MKEKIVVTAALPYANGQSHIGHLLEYIQADIFVRFLKLLQEDALYICASDMHGTPIEMNARKAGVAPEEFAKKCSKDQQKDFASYLIKFDNFYHTDSKENKELAEYFFSELKKKDLIYTKKIEIIYCESCERSLPDRYVKGQCPHCKAEDQYGDVCEKCGKVLKGLELVKPYCATCNSEPIKKESEHYFFKLSEFSKPLKEWINRDKFIQPEVRNWLKSWLKDLDDWCVSRDAPYYGFEIPGSKKETGKVKYFYVWLDAPIGYISSTKNYCDKKKKDWKDYWYQEAGEVSGAKGKAFLHKGNVYHIIGKDIAYFHYLFWPAMLMAVGIPVPKITTHGFITVNGEKMSKSRGTFYTAKDFLQLYNAESLRFYYASHLDRKLVDIDLNLKDFEAVINNVLVANLGNFCYRTLTFATKYDKIAGTDKKSAELNKMIEQVKNYYQELNFKLAVKTILEISDLGNVYFQKAEPWKDKDKKIAEVAWCVNLARNLAIMVKPILPEFSKKVFKALGEKDLHWKDIGFSWKGNVKKPAMLVEKIEKKTDEKSISLTVTPEAEKKGIMAVMAIIKDCKVANNSKKIEERRKKNKLPNINTVVDSYNIVASETGIAMGCHDADKIKGNLKITITKGDEKYIPLGKKDLSAVKSGEISCLDDEKIICWKDEKQCEQTKITKNTKTFLIYAQGKKDLNYIKNSLKKACQLIVDTSGGNFKIKEDEKPESKDFPLQMKVGLIDEVKNHPNADSLYLLNVDFGIEDRQVVAGLKKDFKKKDLLDKKTVFCTNLKKAKLRGEVSEAMILVAEGKKIALLEPSAEVGEEVEFAGIDNSNKEVTFDVFSKLKMKVKDKKIFYEKKELKRVSVNIENGAKIC